MLDHLHPHRREIEHLPAFHSDLHRITEIPAAAGTAGGFVTDDSVRGRHLLETRTGMPRLPTRLPHSGLPQRFRRRLPEPVR